MKGSSSMTGTIVIGSRTPETAFSQPSNGLLSANGLDRRQLKASLVGKINTAKTLVILKVNSS